MSTNQIPPYRYLIPVDGLAIPRSWTVGEVTFHPGSGGEEVLRDAPPFSSTDDYIAGRVREILDSAHNYSLAEVAGVPDVDTAIEVVRASLDALRLLQLARRVTDTTSFGLPGDVYSSRIDYIAIWENSAPGARYHGDGIGWTFEESAYEDWLRSTAFQFLSSALVDRDASDGAYRAATGAQLLARAATEHRPDLKMLGVAAALEAWLLQRGFGTQTMLLARRVSWFGCGGPEADLCGRTRPICPYLRLSPDDDVDRKRLKTLRSLGDSHDTWRCSEWHQVMDWYDARSDAAHGTPSGVSSKQADAAEYWVTHYLMEPILDWLCEHTADPLGDLDQAIDAIDEPSGWPAMLSALDAPSPPAVPPAR